MSRNKYPEETVKLIVDRARMLFIEKGYDKTSIQDIINNLGGLSKGAIYHHFKSKEEIFEAVCEQIGNENIIYYNKMRDVRSKNGFEKLKEMIRSAYNNPNNDAVISMQTKITSDPKFLMSQIQASYEMVVPQYLEPIIREGIEDGSIKTSYPKELASVLITLLNVWINPMIEQVTVDEMKQKLEFLRILLKGIGLDLIDDDIIQQYTQYCEHYSIQKTSLTT